MRSLTTEGRKFCALASAKHADALGMLSDALATGGGIRGAAVELGVGEATLYRLGRTWPAMRKMMSKGRLPPKVRGGMRKAAE